MKASYGFIETRGYVAAIVAADAMVKAAKVDLLPFRKVGGALVTIAVKGELGACQAAVAAGFAAARQVGHVISTHIIANPYDDTESMVESKHRGRGQGRKRTPKPQSAPKQVKASRKSSPTDMIIQHLKKKKQGAKLDELADLLKMNTAEVRLLLKKLMDAGKVEKIQQKYFISDK